MLSHKTTQLMTQTYFKHPALHPSILKASKPSYNPSSDFHAGSFCSCEERAHPEALYGFSLHREKAALTSLHDGRFVAGAD